MEAIVQADNPIEDPTQDQLNRYELAKEFASQICELDVSKGAVVGVLGPWGSGKTSFVNLARYELEKSKQKHVILFNPWLFSGTTQLVESFFSELSAEMEADSHLHQLGTLLRNYGDNLAGLGWLPIVGSSLERVHLLAKLFKRISKAKSGRNGSLRTRRDAIETELKTVNNKPIVVVLDDIDRLTTDEIRDIFKVVRLTACFPNMVYILVFDRIRVEHALSEAHVSGRDYLEKIMYVSVDLPVVPQQMLDNELFEAIKISLYDVESNFEAKFWQRRRKLILESVVCPLVRNMRDIRRYSAAVYGASRTGSFKRQVNLDDLLALEAIRVFLPDVFLGLPISFRALTSFSKQPKGSQDRAQQIERLIEAAGTHRAIVRNLIEMLFPNGYKHIDRNFVDRSREVDWLIDRRVAHADIFRLYLERTVSDDLKIFKEAEDVLEVMADQKKLQEYFEGLDQVNRRKVLDVLDKCSHQFTVEQAMPSTVALFNLWPKFLRYDSPEFNESLRTTIRSIVGSLLALLPDEKYEDHIAHKALPLIRSFFSKLELILLVEKRRNTDAQHTDFHGPFIRRLKNDWCVGLTKSVKEGGIEHEVELLRILLVALEWGNPLDPNKSPFTSASTTLEVLKSASTRRPTSRQWILNWEGLQRFYGSTIVDRLKGVAVCDHSDYARFKRQVQEFLKPHVE